MNIEIKITNNDGEVVFKDSTEVENYDYFCKNYVKAAFDELEKWVDSCVEKGVCPECSGELKIVEDNTGTKENPAIQQWARCKVCGWEG